MTGQQTQAGDEAPAADDGDQIPADSLIDDLAALIEDGQTYVTAEIAYQKSRLSFASAQGKVGVGLLLGALAFVHLALIALVVGLVFALAPVLTPLGATAAVTLVLLVVAALFAASARTRLGAIGRAFAKDGG